MVSANYVPRCPFPLRGSAKPLPWDNVVTKSGCFLSENGNSNAERAPGVNLLSKPIDAGIELRGPQIDSRAGHTLSTSAGSSMRGPSPKQGALDQADFLSLCEKAGHDSRRVHSLVSRVVRFKLGDSDRVEQPRKAAVGVVLRAFRQFHIELGSAYPLKGLFAQIRHRLSALAIKPRP
jgi:hypothetical protein